MLDLPCVPEVDAPSTTLERHHFGLRSPRLQSIGGPQLDEKYAFTAAPPASDEGQRGYEACAAAFPRRLPSLKSPTWRARPPDACTRPSFLASTLSPASTRRWPTSWPRCSMALSPGRSVRITRRACRPLPTTAFSRCCPRQ